MTRYSFALSIFILHTLFSDRLGIALVHEDSHLKDGIIDMGWQNVSGAP